MHDSKRVSEGRSEGKAESMSLLTAQDFHPSQLSLATSMRSRVLSPVQLKDDKTP